MEGNNGKLEPNSESNQVANTIRNSDKGNLSLDGVIDNGPSKITLRPKRRKSKTQARKAHIKGHVKERPSTGKRTGSELLRASPNKKKPKLL